MALRVALLALLAFPGPGAEATTHEPASVVRAFYSTKAGLGARGLPDDAELRSVAPFLDQTLKSRLVQARKMEAACIKAAPPGTKPPIWEGGIFSIQNEGATRLGHARQVVVGASATVTATLELVDSNFPVGHPYHHHAWAVDVKLRRRNGQWLIHDFIADDGYSLSDALYKYNQSKC